MKFIGWLLAAVVTAFSSPCFSENSFWQGETPPPQSIRIAHASKWLASYKKVVTQIPTLSPSESNWLRHEYDGQIAANSGYLNSRALAAMDSTEFHKKRAREGLEYMLDTLKKLSSRSGLTPTQEARLWGILVAEMIDPPLWQSIETLIERKVVGAEINGIKHSYLLHHAAWGSTILYRVVIPLLG